MSIQQESELNKLRESARCVICKEFYDKPKKLPNCCHACCLRCIKQLLQSSEFNFPPCPICREPITTPYADVDKLDPARAEQDIVDFVKKIEKCGFCRLESNPNLKCLQCNLFVCDICEACHKKLKPSHAVVPIVSTEASGQESQVITCTKHQGQLMDLFCINCSQAACVLCKEYTHRNCKIYRTDKSSYWPSTIPNKREPSVVYLPDYANKKRTWLRRVDVELLACIKFAKEYIANLNEIIVAQISCSVLSNRVHLICSEADRLFEISKKTQLKVNSLLKESATDYRVAEGIDGVKQQCLDVFKYRRNFSFHTQPVRFDMSTNIRLLVNCNLRKLENEWAFCKPYYLGHEHAAPDLRIPSPTADKSSNIENMHNKDTSILPTLVCLFKGNILNNSEKTVSFRKLAPEGDPRGRTLCNLQGLSYGWIEYKHMSDLSSVFGTENILYTNEFLEKTNETKSTTILPSAATFKPSARQYETIATTYEISAGFAEIVTQSSRNDIEFEIYKEEHGIPFIGFYFDSSRVHCFTPFINIIALPGWFDYMYLGTRAASTNQLDFPFICIIGNRGIDAGLETVFLFEDGAKKLTHCISVLTNTAKLTGGNLHPGRGNISFDVMKSTTGNFVVYASKSENWLSYHTTLPTTSVPESFTLRFDREDLETEVPITSIITDLLCSLKSGLYFVQHAKEGTLNIGKLEFKQTGVKEHIIKTIKEENTNISLLKLKPLSMVENKQNEIVVVCSVKDDNTKLIIILTNKEGNEAIEVLDIEYPTLTLSGPENESTPPETAQPRVLDVLDHTTIDHFAEAVIVDLEMDETDVSCTFWKLKNGQSTAHAPDILCHDNIRVILHGYVRRKNYQGFITLVMYIY